VTSSRMSKPGAVSSPERSGVLTQSLHGPCSVSLQAEPDRCSKISLGPVCLTEGSGPSCCFSDELWRWLGFGGWYRPCSAEKSRHSTRPWRTTERLELSPWSNWTRSPDSIEALMPKDNLVLTQKAVSLHQDGLEQQSRGSRRYDGPAGRCAMSGIYIGTLSR
jgi:hypothetical protein